MAGRTGQWSKPSSQNRIEEKLPASAEMRRPSYETGPRPPDSSQIWIGTMLPERVVAGSAVTAGFVDVRICRAIRVRPRTLPLPQVFRRPRQRAAQQRAEVRLKRRKGRPNHVEGRPRKHLRLWNFSGNNQASNHRNDRIHQENGSPTQAREVRIDQCSADDLPRDPGNAERDAERREGFRSGAIIAGLQTNDCQNLRERRCCRQPLKGTSADQPPNICRQQRRGRPSIQMRACLG